VVVGAKKLLIIALPGDVEVAPPSVRRPSTVDELMRALARLNSEDTPSGGGRVEAMLDGGLISLSRKYRIDADDEYGRCAVLLLHSSVQASEQEA
jgi:hypothetical protein